MTKLVEEEPQKRGADLYRLTKTDLDPSVRRRAHAPLLVEESHAQASAARLLHALASRVHIWLERFTTEGRVGVVDQPRGAVRMPSAQLIRRFLKRRLTRGHKCTACL